MERDEKLEMEYLILKRVLEERAKPQGWLQRLPDLLKMALGADLTCSNDDLKALIEELCKNELIKITLFDESSEVFLIFRGSWDDFTRFQPWFQATEKTINRFWEQRHLNRLSQGMHPYRSCV